LYQKRLKRLSSCIEKCVLFPRGVECVVGRRAYLTWHIINILQQGAAANQMQLIYKLKLPGNADPVQ
jgi:hypothetical protein